LVIFAVESFLIARIRSTDLDFRKADFKADERIFLPSVEKAMLFTELELLLIDGSVGWSSGSCRLSDERHRLS
jgi:hypothetical protein